MQTEHTPLLSIIVPIYNVEEYLPECLDSIFAQTFTDYELILVDDGSPDNCPKICDEAASKDARVRVIHQKNGGLSAARNAGLDIARGEWIGFIDSDDMIPVNYYETLYRAAQDGKAELAVCNLCLVDEQGNKLRKQYLGVRNEVLSAEDVLAQIECVVFHMASNKVYHRNVFAELRYPEGKLNEDTFLVVDLFCKAKRVACTEKTQYFYRKTPGSIMNKKKTLRNLDWVEANYTCMVKLQACGSTAALPKCEKELFASLREVYYSLLPEERRTPRAKQARKYQREAAVMLAKRGQLSGRVLLRTLLFQGFPGVYEKIWKKKGA